MQGKKRVQGKEQMSSQDLNGLIDLERYQLDDPLHITNVKARLYRNGVVT